VDARTDVFGLGCVVYEMLAALAERLAVRIASKLPALPGLGPSPSRG